MPITAFFYWGCALTGTPVPSEGGKHVKVYLQFKNQWLIGLLGVASKKIPMWALGDVLPSPCLFTRSVSDPGRVYGVGEGVKAKGPQPDVEASVSLVVHGSV